MKYSELDESEKKAKFSRIDQDWEIHTKWRLESLDLITRYLFTLNSGGLLASLAYLAAKEEVNGVNTIITLFFAGTMCIALRAAIDYYISEARLSSLRKDVESFYSDEIEFEDYLERLNKRYEANDLLLHLLGWSSGILFIVAIVIGIGTIQPKAGSSGGIRSEAAPLFDAPQSLLNMDIETTIAVAVVVISFCSLLAAIINSHAAHKSANAVQKQAEASIVQAEALTSQVEIQKREFKEKRRLRRTALSTKTNYLWRECHTLDLIFQIPERREAADLRSDKYSQEFVNLFVEFMKEQGPYLAVEIGVDSQEWQGLRYLEDMFWTENFPQMYTGIDQFLEDYGPINILLRKITDSLLRET
jgi:hypothetical protein